MFKVFRKNKFIQFTIGIFLLWIIFLIFFFLVPFFGLTKPNTFAELGDAFGAFNALFSAFAFVGVIYTILMQKDELAMQKDELALQRKQMARANTIQQMIFQAESLSKNVEQIIQLSSVKEPELQSQLKKLMKGQSELAGMMLEMFKTWQLEDSLDKKVK